MPEETIRFFVLNTSVPYFKEKLGSEPKFVKSLGLKISGEKSDVSGNLGIYSFDCPKDKVGSIDISKYVLAKKGIWNMKAPGHPSIFYKVEEIPEMIPEIVFTPFHNIMHDGRDVGMKTLRVEYLRDKPIVSIFSMFFGVFGEYSLVKEKNEGKLVYPPLVLVGSTMTRREIKKIATPKPRFLQDWIFSTQPSSEQPSQSPHSP